METKPIVFCDFDGTITELDVTDLILSELAPPSWREIEQQWVRNAIGSRECMERQFALVEASDAELDALIDAVPVDPGFPRFYRFLEARQIPFYVVSDSLDYVIRRVLRRVGMNGELENGVHLFAGSLGRPGKRLAASFPFAAPDCQHGCGTCKEAIVRRLAGARHPVIFIGDGLSDRFAIEASHLVFAKRQLLAYCREKGIGCQAFETFADVQAALSRELAVDVSRRS